MGQSPLFIIKLESGCRTSISLKVLLTREPTLPQILHIFLNFMLRQWAAPKSPNKGEDDGQVHTLATESLTATDIVVKFYKVASKV